MIQFICILLLDIVQLFVLQIQGGIEIESLNVLTKAFDMIRDADGKFLGITDLVE
jgi:Co/Zn/Cd efflux system component